MAKIITITNPLTGQPAQVDQLDHTAQQIDEGIKRAREYGLGTVGKRLYSSDDLNTIWESGFYSWGGTNKPANFIDDAPSEFWISVMEVISYGDGGVYIQRVWGLANTEAPILAQRVKYGDTIRPWEYDNPPMELGKEYRTTERWNGKPVYAMLIDFGALPNATYKIVAHGIANIKHVIQAYGSAGGKIIPTNNFSGTRAYSVSVVADKTDIVVLTDFDASAYSSNIIVKYTKTTD